MSIRDPQTLEAVMLTDFKGYARRRRPLFAPDAERIAACVAVLGTMVVSGVVLGSPRSGTAAR